MTIRSRMSSILNIIGLEQPVLFALELKKIAIFHFVYTLALSTNQHQTWSKYLRSGISTILDLIGQPELFALE